MEKIRKLLYQINQIDEGNDLSKKFHDEVIVYFVDGNFVRKEYFIDFTMGGHHYIYDWIPEKEIWIDDSLDEEEDINATILHERVERDLMKNFGYSYEEAHDISSSVEVKARRNEKYVNNNR